MLLVKPKQYFLRDKFNKDIIKFKGVPHKNLNLDVFKIILDTKKYEYNRIVKFKEGLRRNLIINSEIKVPKNFDIEDNKRLWENKFNVNNFEISKPIKL